MNARKHTYPVLLLACALALLLLPAAAHAGGYLKIDGISGDATDPGHENEIDISAYSYDIAGGSNSRPGVSPGSGAGGGRAKFSEFTVEKRLDRSSPALLNAVAAGQHFRSATLTLRDDQDEGHFDYLVYCFTDVRLTRLAQSWGGDGFPQEVVGLGYSTLVERYNKLGNDGETASWVGGFDLVRNRLLNTC